jgi:hypothetical protein
MPIGAVLIGAGPSLNRIDPRRLAGLDAITFNRAWLAWDEWGFAPRYHACLDPRSIGVFGPELPPIVASRRSTKFFLHSDAAGHGVEPGNNVTFCGLAAGSAFSRSVTALTDFGNVGAISMQLLHLLGYRKILMVGVDGDYLPETQRENDVNHFRDDYARGRVVLTPELRAHYTSQWPVVAAECRRCGIEVRNASPGTALTCFETVGFDEGLRWLSSSEPQVRPALSSQGLNS